jgi:uncharacterized protein (TIGR03382 family)
MYLGLRLASLLLLVPAAAYAFEIETPVSERCHEKLTLDAAANAVFPNFSQAPVPTDEQRRAMNDLVFDLPRRDPWTLALLIGVRSNDLEDRAPTDTAGLIHVHDDPDKQDEHCIRRGDDDGVAGNASALAACRAFILGELEAGGLLADQIDFAATEPVKSFFKFRGVYTIQLPKFAYRLGRAIHAVEDSYAHAMRDPESGNVRHVLNWVDAYGGADYDEERDGYPHLSTLDDCLRSDTIQLKRIQHARIGATSIFYAIATEGAGRRARVEAAVDAALALTPNCSPENDYCNAPELEEPTDFRGWGCNTSGAPASLLFVLALLAVITRRRAALVALVALAPMVAYAQATTPEPAPAGTPSTEGPEATQPPSDQAPDKDLPAEVQDKSDFTRWHFDARAGGAWDDPAIAGALGIAVDYKKWSVGFYGEWNPWLSFDQVGSTRPGVANAYLAFSYRWYHSDKIALATRIELGGSMMLFELLGIDKYTFGIYLGGALTTVRFPINKRMSLTFDPIHFALPAPRPFGLPFYYKQYRVTFGLEVAL